VKPSSLTGFGEERQVLFPKEGKNRPACRGDYLKKAIRRGRLRPPREAASGTNRVLKNKHPAVSQGVRRFGKRSLFLSTCEQLKKIAQRRITASGAYFQCPVKVFFENSRYRS